MSITSGIKNIIFDWGGVIINIDYSRTRNAFIELGLENFDEHFNQFKQNEFFDKFDTGKISGEEFFKGIQKKMPENVSTEQIRRAWNSMLLDFPEKNYKILQKANEKYRSFLFSNTNEPHLEYYFKKLPDMYGIEAMDPLFEKAYYSCRFGMRKPNPESFEHILRENDLIGKETLFIDDSWPNIEGAKKAGLKTYLLEPPETLPDIFNGSL